MDLSVIIVSYNTRELLAKCLESVGEEIERSRISAEVIVVDNGSQDGSIETVHKFIGSLSSFRAKSRNPVPMAIGTISIAPLDPSAPLRSARDDVVLIENMENLGFGKANNQGVREAKGRYILFLNSDTEVKSGALAKMVDFLDKNPKVGIASCKLLNSDGTMQPQGGYLPRLSTVAVWALFVDDLPGLREILPSYQNRSGKSGKSGRSGGFGWVGGTAMFVRRETWKQLEGFDEKIFMYGEDVELCYRANKQGWKTAVNPEAEIAHTGKSSGGKWVTGEVEGLLYIFRKHKPGWEMPILRAILAAGMGLRWVIFGILGGNENLRKAYAEAFEEVTKNRFARFLGSSRLGVGTRSE